MAKINCFEFEISGGRVYLLNYQGYISLTNNAVRVVKCNNAINLILSQI